MSRFPKLLVRAAVVTLAAATLVLPTTSGVASAAAQAQPAQARRSVCVNAHVQNIGWQGRRCYHNGQAAFAGTVGQSLRMESLSISTRGTGGVCAQGHVQNVGWQPVQCVGDNQTVTVGTVGQSLRLEALRLRTGTGVCARAHVQNIGWQRWNCARNSGHILLGTVGQSLRLEALNIRV